MENIPKYIRVKHGQEQPDYLHPKLEPVLRETLGILIYQEQVMQAAQILAGYSLGSADLLRRAMGKKKKDEMAQQRANFIKGAVERAVPADQAGMIFDQIDKFAGYGFNKSHAAAYALIAYQTAYLKANYPTEFFAATRPPRVSAKLQAAAAAHAADMARNNYFDHVGRDGKHVADRASHTGYN